MAPRDTREREETTAAGRERGAGRTATTSGGPSGSAGKEDSNENLMAVAAHFTPFPLEVIFFVIGDDNDDITDFVRYHAAHSLAYSVFAPVASVLLTVVGMVLMFLGMVVLTVLAGLMAGEGGGLAFGVFFALFTFLPIVMSLAFAVIGVGLFGVWIYFVVAAARGSRPRVPVLSTVADAIYDLFEDDEGTATAGGAGHRSTRR